MGWILGLCAVAVAWFGWQSFSAAAMRAKARAGYLDACMPLFTNTVTALAETGFARISGRYRGQTFDVQVVPDSLSVRKLPVLWLLVTLPERLPIHGTCDVMLRATGLETFSGFAALPDQIVAPAGFPADCTIRTDAPGQLQQHALICRYLAAQDKARLKEVVVAPSGVRIVWLGEEADRGRYLLFRDAEMGAGGLSPLVLQPLMDGLCDFWAALLVGATPQRQASG
jgi:hypothetical protein